MENADHQTIAQILIAKGLLTQNQITKALEYQCRLPPGQYMPFTQILLEFEYLSEQELADALGNEFQYMEDPIGQIMLEQGLVSPQQLEQALKILESFPKGQVANVLIDLGFVTRTAIEQAVSKHQLEQSGHARLEVAFYQESTPRLAPSAAEPVHQSAELPLSPVQQAVVHLPLGRQLIAKGYINEDELKDAIEYQQRLPKMMYKPIGQILIELGYISQQQLDETLAEQPSQPRSRIGELLIQEGLITDWQLAHALSLQFSSEHAHKKLGALLVELGYARREEIEGAVTKHYRSNPPTRPQTAPLPDLSKVSEATPPVHQPLGQILLSKAYISREQLEEALSEQEKLSREHKPLGDILVLKGYISELQLQECLAEQPGFVREPIGQILIKQGVIEDWQLSHALCCQFDEATQTRKNLGAVVVELGYSTQEAIEAAVLNYYKQQRQP